MDLLLSAMELYPNSGYLFDSAGEFYRELGDLDNAVKYYEKALEINPYLANSKKKLEQIKK